MADIRSVLNVPSMQVSPWVVDTDPDEARHFIERLPLDDHSTAAQELYQGLFTLNRQTLEPETRLALMELYRVPLQTVLGQLEAHLLCATFPLKPQVKKLSDFLIQFERELAFGYKHVVRDVLGERGSGKGFHLAVARAIHQLGAVLYRCYEVYAPAPTDHWREIYTLLRLAEDRGFLHEQVIAEDASSAPLAAALQVMLLSLAGPYQLPRGEVRLVRQFLARHARLAVYGTIGDDIGIEGSFIADIDSDTAPLALPRDIKPQPAPMLRIIQTLPLAREAYRLVLALEKGEPARNLLPDVECTDAAALDFLRRLLGFLGMSRNRQFTRRRPRRGVSLCFGVHALHFFASGERPLPPARASSGADRPLRLPALDDLPADNTTAISDVYRAEANWQVRDESAGGLALARRAEAGMGVRVGDLIGVNEEGSPVWRPAVVRWVKSPGPQDIELGLELLAATATPVSIVLTVPPASPRQVAALRLPAMPLLRQPATLLVARGAIDDIREFSIVETGGETRAVTVLTVAERTGGFERLVFADRAESAVPFRFASSREGSAG